MLGIKMYGAILSSCSFELSYQFVSSAQNVYITLRQKQRYNFTEKNLDTFGAYLQNPIRKQKLVAGTITKNTQANSSIIL